MIDLIKTLLFSISIGILFGFALEKSKVYLPSFIIGQMNFTYFVMIKVFFTAIAVGMFIMALLQSIGVVIEFTSYSYLRSIVGGTIMGLGVALAGACPGTVVVQVSAGYKRAFITILGALSGAIFYALCESKILLELGTEKCSYKSLYEIVDSGVIASILCIIIIGILIYRYFRSIKKLSN